MKKHLSIFLIITLGMLGVIFFQKNNYSRKIDEINSRATVINEYLLAYIFTYNNVPQNIDELIEKFHDSTNDLELVNELKKIFEDPFDSSNGYFQVLNHQDEKESGEISFSLVSGRDSQNEVKDVKTNLKSGYFIFLMNKIAGHKTIKIYSFSLKQYLLEQKFYMNINQLQKFFAQKRKAEILGIALGGNKLSYSSDSCIIVEDISVFLNKDKIIYNSDSFNKDNLKYVVGIVDSINHKEKNIYFNNCLLSRNPH